MDPAQTTNLIKQLARDQGFHRVGVVRAGPLPHRDYLRQWLEAGYAGEMDYLQRHVPQRGDPTRLLPGARSVVVVALSYRQDPPPPDSARSGRVAMYAWGEDYHRVLKDKLRAIVEQLHEQVSQPFEARSFVDTAPLLERELAMAAGIGWIGKNTMVLHQDVGSYFFLGEIVTTLDALPDAVATDHCGSCTRCLEACPTAAFPQPYRMDARRCISYHTIELRDDIPQQFHDDIAEWIFGCDICQEVCPFNHAAPVTAEPRLAARAHAAGLNVDEVLDWEPESYREALRHTAVKRAKLHMLQRNARIVAANLERDGGRLPRGA